MNKYLLLTILATGSCFVQAQTKGTNSLGLGIGIQKHKFEQSFPGYSSVSDQQTTGFSISYGQFIKLNEKAGIDLFYGNSNFNTMPENDFSTNTYGGKLTYQKYFQLFKAFYAFGGGRGAYNYSDGSMQQQAYRTEFSTHESSLGAYGGVSWFLSKRFALEADLLSANIGYIKTTQNSVGTSGTFKTTSGNFDLSSAGAVSNPGFKIHFLF